MALVLAAAQPEVAWLCAASGDGDQAELRFQRVGAKALAPPATRFTIVPRSTVTGVLLPKSRTVLAVALLEPAVDETWAFSLLRLEAGAAPRVGFAARAGSGLTLAGPDSASLLLGPQGPGFERVRFFNGGLALGLHERPSDFPTPLAVSLDDGAPVILLAPTRMRRQARTPPSPGMGCIHLRSSHGKSCCSSATNSK